MLSYSSLFSLMMGSCFKYTIFLLFADDIKIYCRVSNVQDGKIMQEDPQRIDLYCNYNQLDLNASNCFLMSFSRKRHVFRFNYQKPYLREENYFKQFGCSA